MLSLYRSSCGPIAETGINELVRDLAKNIRTKARTFSTGETRGGISKAMSNGGTDFGPAADAVVSLTCVHE